ncbi:MAG: phosphatidylserine/phosphatidylglycerophosphate/cardiolipin synthase family protein [Vulcanimicrobiota bacterium]
MQITTQFAPHRIAGFRPPLSPTRSLEQPTAHLPLDGLADSKLAAEPPTLEAARELLTGDKTAEAGIGKQIEDLLARALSDPEAEKQLIGLLQVLNATGQLKPMLHELTRSAAETGAIPPIPEAKRNDMVDQAAGMIDAQFRERGMTPDTVGTVYVDWPELSAAHLRAVRDTQAPPRMPGGLSLLTDPVFVAEMEALQGAKFLPGNSVKVLNDGPASFAERDRMIDEAKTSIQLMSWAFYDDLTGWETARKLAEKAEQGVDVKVLVDGQVSQKSHHNAPISFLEESGVEVVRWRDPERPYDGNHRKMMIVDGREAVIGGINLGDVYSHKAGDVKWRDTDVLLTGPAVDEGSKLFARLWNTQVQGTGKSEVNLPSAASPITGGVRSAVVNHAPGPEGDAHILLSTMKAIEGATESVDIENAYFINTPGMKEVLLKALDDGVKVRILTNSAESIDEPLITAPILASFPDLLAAGAEVYLKKGDTLHSKFMVVDGLFTSVGSHNHHPRSQRFEGEMMLHSLDANLAAEMGQAFEADIAAATRVHTAEELNIPESPLGALAMRYFYDAL